ncbi:MAG: undecaprenyl-diphosphatase [Actinomycetota bacterium]|nr:undecaprenyl-diphosphatase [Actinomycetota bacterium]
MPILHAIVLGITQGISEFLPISSSGHLRLVPWLLGWHDFDGRTQLEQTFDVALHIGTLAATVTYFWRDLVSYAVEGVRGIARPRDMTPTGQLAWLLLLSALPAAVAGALLEDTFAKIADHEWVIGLMLVAFGLLLGWSDRLPGERAVDDYRASDATLAGAAQILALVPGVSRSGITMTATRRLRFDRDAAARLSFLMALPITGGAVLKKGVDLLGDFPHGFAAPFAWGIVSSAITGFAAVWFTLRFVRTHTFRPFVVYRVVVGAGVVLIAISGLR